jgi:very-short-patch-repair endonuclease
VDFESGEVFDSVPDESRGGARRQRLERVSLAVRATQNLLLVRLVQPELRGDAALEVTLRYALQRGLEETFQLEETELAAEPVGAGDHRAMLLYEAAEGGAGVLRRLVEEADALAEVARTALEMCHFQLSNGRTHDLKPDCRAACYECLLSFANQQEALALDRHAIRELLIELAQSRTEMRLQGRSREEHLAWLHSLTDARSELERRFLQVLAEGGYRLPDEAQKSIPQPQCLVDFFYAPNVCIFCDGRVHDQRSQAEKDGETRSELERRGYRVVVLRYDQEIEEQVGRYPEIFGGPCPP